jgi:putative ABC transport system permease protein
MRLALPESKYKEPHQISGFYERALGGIATVPGVTSASLTSSLPFSNGGDFPSFTIEGRPALLPGELRTAQTVTISPNYFEAMHVALLQGRGFSDRDRQDSQRVAIIGESLARRYWPGENPLGRRVKLGGADAQDLWMTIVGVAEDVRYSWIDRNPTPALYRPYRQAANPYTQVALRITRDPAQLISAVRRQIGVVDPDLPVFEVKTLDRVISDSIIGLAYVAVMMAVLGVIALVLACVGVYGVMAYAVSERTREIGIRMALGAERAQVLRLVIARGMLVTGIGLTIGFAVSFMLARLLSGLIFGVSAMDWVTFGGVSMALTASAVAASYVPARRATRIDPIVALRYE